MFATSSASVASYRSRTNGITAKMNNVSQIPKKCKCIACNKHRTESTGKHCSDGFVCGMCMGAK